MSTHSSSQTRVLSGPNQAAFFALVSIASAYGLYRAIALAWVCDDAFFTFRYAKNLVDGYGLVYNIGERVEGYTSFLWTILIALGRRLGFESIAFSHVLSIASYLLTALVLMLFSYRHLAIEGRKSVIVLPVAALSILVMQDYHVWATSGMETSLTAFLIALAVCLLLSAQKATRFAVAGVVMAAAVMSRPEAMIALALGGLFILIARRPVLRNLLYYSVPAIVLYIPYWIIRYSYYGYPFPNTYYAKSGNLAYWSQGWVYLWLFIKSYYVLFLLVPAAVWLVYRMLRQIKGKGRPLDMISRTGLLCLMIVVPSVIYVVRVGGDFMFARFFIPITALCFLAIEAALASLRLPAAVRIAAGFAIVVMSWGSIYQFDAPQQGVEGIVDERTFYPPELIGQARTDGELLKRVFTGTDSVAVAFYGMKAMLMYYAEFPVAIEAHAGLTDEYVAHQPIEERGRPGHEKKAPYEYLRQRRVLFSFPAATQLTPVKKIWFGNQEAAIVHWDNRVMEHLKQFSEVRFVDFPGFLDQYLERIDERPDILVRRDLEQFRQYYFDFNDDPERLEQFLARLGG
ncbi:MAG: hypothetical protein JSU74_09610 [Candidatus Zixiibacteriota bacterium]|nr:MAG: hypothetical protein JSU74_09610 [candidate division Zixibacteria bacterium]